MQYCVWLISLLVLGCLETSVYGEAEQRTPRTIPMPMAGHPGNVFLEGEEVTIPVPFDIIVGEKWRVLNEILEVVKEGEVNSLQATDLSLPLGKLKIGWYRIEFLNIQGKVNKMTTAAVLARLAAPIPDDSPVCIDGALSWHQERKGGEREQHANLAALAGANWIRDRLRWSDIQPAADVYAGTSVYDQMAEVQNNLGLHVLQVFHGIPGWAQTEKYGSLPADLRVTYQFCKLLTKRFKGKVQAWEPWNEGNAANFGGQIIDEMCSYQKAAYLGFKAGGGNIPVGWQPIGGINVPALTDGILANETWPYYDTYNIHSYDTADSYEELWQHARKAACGKPVWVTESDRGMNSDPGSDMGDFTTEYDMLKAKFIAQSFACSLHAGAEKHFHFLLGHYMEQNDKIQFGLLRRDLTPRPSFVAFAAVGRFLAGAKCLGRWIIPNQPDVYVIAFRAFPDGQERDVLVAWTELCGGWDQRGRAVYEWDIAKDLTVNSVYDYLGRPLAQRVPGSLTSSPVFVIMPSGEAGKLELSRPALSTAKGDKPTHIVLQLLLPEVYKSTKVEGWTEINDRAVSATAETELKIVAYNFGDQPVSGNISVESIPSSWNLNLSPVDTTLEPLERKEIQATIKGSGAVNPEIENEWIRIRGDFGEAGRPCLAFRMKTLGK